MATTKRFEFIDDYSSKQGFRVKKGEVLSAYYSKGSSNPRWMFEWYEGIDKDKAESGDGTFSVFESEMASYIKETTAPVKRIKEEEKQGSIVPDSDLSNRSASTTNNAKKPFFKTTGGYVVIALVVAGLGFMAYKIIKKK